MEGHVQRGEALQSPGHLIGEHMYADRTKTDGSFARVAVGVVVQALTLLGIEDKIASGLLAKCENSKMK